MQDFTLKPFISTYVKNLSIPLLLSMVLSLLNLSKIKTLLQLHHISLLSESRPGVAQDLKIRHSHLTDVIQLMLQI